MNICYYFRHFYFLFILLFFSTTKALCVLFTLVTDPLYKYNKNVLRENINLENEQKKKKKSFVLTFQKSVQNTPFPRLFFITTPRKISYVILFTLIGLLFNNMNTENDSSKQLFKGHSCAKARIKQRLGNNLTN